MNYQNIKLIHRFLTNNLYRYNKPKANLLKAFLPILIIIHHIDHQGYTGVELIEATGDVVMYFFFAMSGCGLVISYLHRDNYLNGFLQRSLLKLFLPYFIALIIFVIYRWWEGINQIELFKTQGFFSFVPTSWYIFTLSYFYVFFFIIFRYISSNNLIKVVLVCILVLAYCVIAPHIGIERWRYFRCPAFCIGMFFALFDTFIRTRLKRWHFLIGMIVTIVAINSTPHRYAPFLYSSLLFFVLYLIGDIKEIKLTKFLSSISLEMFIIQFIPIYIVMDDLNVTKTQIMVPLVIMIDIIFAYMIHKLIKKIESHLFML